MEPVGVFGEVASGETETTKATKGYEGHEIKLVLLPFAIFVRFVVSSDCPYWGGCGFRPRG